MVSSLCIFTIMMSTSFLTLIEANQMRRIENKLKSLDLKLTANSIDISTLKTDVADTNRKLDMLLELLNGTQASQQVDDTKDIQPDDRQATHRLSASRDLKNTIKDEVSRVRRAFLSEKKKLSLQQKEYEAQFIGFAEKLNTTLNRLDNMHESKLDTLTNNMQHELESTLTKIGKTVDSMNYTQDLSKIANILELHDNKTERLFKDVLQSNADGFTKSNTVIQSHDSETRRLLSVILRETVGVRVVGSPSGYGIEGKLEVLVNGAWGKVCNSGFDDTDATIACKALGYPNGKNTSPGTTFLVLLQDTAMDYVSCKGKEKSLQECRYGRTHYCG